jgi:hypothetical protein
MNHEQALMNFIGDLGEMASVIFDALHRFKSVTQQNNHHWETIKKEQKRLQALQLANTKFKKNKGTFYQYGRGRPKC